MPYGYKRRVKRQNHNNGGPSFPKPGHWPVGRCKDNCRTCRENR